VASVTSLGSAADTTALGEQREVEAWQSAQRGEPPQVKEKPRFSWPVQSLLDALVAGTITFALGLFFVGLTTDGVSGPLAIRSRWPLLFTLVAIVFAVRLILNLLFFKNPKPLRIAVGRRSAEASNAFSIIGKIIGVALLLGAFVFPFLILHYLPGYSRQYLDLAILILTYVMLGWGLNIVVGLAGLLDLGYVAFYAVGAYSFALIAQHSGLGFWTCLPLAGLFAAAWGIILGFPVLRLRGDYLAIVTLAFGEIIRIILLNWNDFTGGPNGITGIPKPTFFGMEFSRGEDGVAAFLGIPYSNVHRFIWLYYIILGLALLTNFVTLRLRRLPIGRAWEALREDEIACRSLGINTTNTKLTAFAMGAMFGGIAGSFFATRQGFISPESFSFIESAIILAIVVLGGLGSQIGVVLAAFVLIGGSELLRNLGFLQRIFGPNFDPVQYRMLIFGLVMVIIMVWRPRGLVSSRSPSAVLKEKKRIGAALVAQGEGH
jgi:branched-chain amino acid transport system permease protein